MRYNPFKLGSVVHLGMFSGRKKEITLIEKCLFQTKHGNPQNFLIHGERGIGKSSLILYAKYLAEGILDNKYNFIVVKIDLEPNYTFLDIIQRLISETEIKLNQLNSLGSIKNMISKIQTSYISIKEKQTPNHMLIAQVADLFKQISDKKI